MRTVSTVCHSARPGLSNASPTAPAELLLEESRYMLILTRTPALCIWRWSRYSLHRPRRYSRRNLDRPRNLEKSITIKPRHDSRGWLPRAEPQFTVCIFVHAALGPLGKRRSKWEGTLGQCKSRAEEGSHTESKFQLGHGADASSTTRA